jgi:hypothetical protein
MVLVSHKHQFIATKTAKSASTAVEFFFSEFCRPSEGMPFKRPGKSLISENGIIGSRNFLPNQRPTFWHHMPAADLRKALPEDVWNNYLKFCVIRNPFEKVISAFYFFYANKDGATLNEFDPKSQQDLFCDWLFSKNPKLGIDRMQYTIDGEICMDIFLRQENLAADITALCGRIGLPCDLNKLSRPKSGNRPKQATCSLLYNDAAREFVEKKFEFELKTFGYTFPG